MKMNQIPDETQKFKDELRVEQHKRYMSLQNDLDDCEKTVGAWNPANKFSTIYDTLDTIHDEIDEFNANNEDTKTAQTPQSSAMPP